MSESKHTPGPWRWMDESEGVPNADNDGTRGVSFLIRDIEGDMDDIAVLQHIHDCDDWGEDHPYRKRHWSKTQDGGIEVNNPADLPLIAAAPDLLAACEALLEIYYEQADSKDGRVYKQAKAAIAKATPTRAT